MEKHEPLFPQKSYRWRVTEASVPSLLNSNFDGSMIPDWKTAGIGSIIQNHTGVMVGTFAEAISTTYALEAGFMALFRGIQLCISFGLSNIIHEGDSYIIREKLQNSDTIPW